jgi:purine-binding chemotaxis protein CheW
MTGASAPEGQRLSADMKEIQAACFRLDEELYAVDIMRIREIIRPQKLTRLVKAPTFIEGVINLRGTVIPVVDIRRRFDLPVREIDFRTKLLIVSAAGTVLGLVVDEVTEVVTIPVENIKPPPAVVKGVGGDYLIGVCLVRDSLISLLNIDRIINSEEKSELVTLQAPAQ